MQADAPAGAPLWLVLNPASGSVSPAAAEAVIAALDNAGLAPAQTRRIGEGPLPTRAELESAGVRTLAIFAGDGSINQQVALLGDWRGDVLVLPGGTMNLLPRSLHGASPPADIVAALPMATRRHIPAVESGDYMAYVGIIAGPLAAWARPREALRSWRLSRFLRGLKVAVGRLASPGIRVLGAGGERLPGRGMAVTVTPSFAGLQIASLTATGLRTLADIGRNWAVDGDWAGARDVQQLTVPQAALISGTSIITLFDGEERVIPSPMPLRATLSQVRFLSTRQS